MQFLAIYGGCFALAAFAFYENVWGTPVEWWLYVPLIVLFAVGLLRRQSLLEQRSRILALIALMAAMAVIHTAPLNGLKPFLRNLYSIQPGMTEVDVRRIMGQYPEGTGWPVIYGGNPPGTGTLNDLGTGDAYAAGSTPDGELTLNDSIVFRPSAEPGDSNWGIVTFKDGKVTGVSFSHD